MHKILAVLLFLLVSLGSNAQQTNQFDFQIQRLDDTNYEMQLQFNDTENVQFIRFTFLEKGNDLEIYEASLNKKSDGKYYLFFQNEEFQIQPDFFTLSFSHDYGELKEPGIRVEVLDFNFNLLDTKEQIIL